MLQNFRKLLLLSLFVLLFTGCARKYSSDAPLTPSYYPSIVIGSDNHVVYAIDPATGKKNWEFGVSGPIVASPLLYKEIVYICCANNDTVYKLNVQTGALISKFVVTIGSGYNVTATPVADGNLIYMTTSNGTIFAFDTGSGAIAWSFTAAAPITSSPTVYNGYVYFGGMDGNVYCLDKTLGSAATTGNWTYTAVPTVPGYSVQFSSSPAMNDSLLFIGCNDSMVLSIYTTGTVAGTLKWAYKTKGAVNSSPTLYGGACIFGCADFHIYSIDIADDVPRWIDSANSDVNSSPFAYNNMIYIGSNDYNLYCVNAINGGLKWKFKSFGIIKSSPIAYNGVVYVGSYDKNLYALDTATGSIKWQYNINGQMECSPVIDNLTGTSYNSSISGAVQ